MSWSPAELGAFVWAGKTRIQRFWEKVDKSAGPDGCWVWTGSLTGRAREVDDAKKYGQTLDWRHSPRCYPIRAHQLSWALANERWPEPGEVVRHTCDNPPCCNPAHLVIGTHKDNMRDSRERKRNSLWVTADERTEAIRAMVRRRPQPNMSEMARELGISRQAVEQRLLRLEADGVVQRVEWVLTEDLVSPDAGARRPAGRSLPPHRAVRVVHIEAPRMAVNLLPRPEPDPKAMLRKALRLLERAS